MKTKRNLSEIAEEYNSDAEVKKWSKIAKLQHCRDKIIIKTLLPYFRKGVTLEIGAGVGQISNLLSGYGLVVIASDYSDKFITHMQKEQLSTIKANAMNLKPDLKDFSPDNVYAQGLSTLIQTNCDGLKETYQSVYDILKNQGRFIIIHPNHKDWNHINDHYKVFLSVGFKVVKVWRQQMMPSQFYCYIPEIIVLFLEKIIGRLLGKRSIIVLEK